MKMTVLSVLLAASFGAGATNNNPPNDCGNHGNNCQPSSGDNEFSSHANSSSNSTGIGVGFGIGGDSSASVGDIRNTNTAAGGSVVGSGNSSNHNSATGGQGGSAVAVGGKGGSAHQGQIQGQQMSQGQSTDVNASSSNDNRSNASGNATNVNIGGDTYQAKRNAPAIMAGNVFPTASCKSGFGIGGSGTAGGGLLNIATTDKECQVVVLSQNFSAIGRDETACLLLKTTKTWERSIKKDPALASLDCSPKPAPAAAPVLVAPELAPRIPRG